jgi:hypothetical protein
MRELGAVRYLFAPGSPKLGSCDHSELSAYSSG